MDLVCLLKTMLTFVNGRSSSVIRNSLEEVWCILLSTRLTRTGRGLFGSVSLYGCEGGLGSRGTSEEAKCLSSSGEDLEADLEREDLSEPGSRGPPTGDSGPAERRPFD